MAKKQAGARAVGRGIRRADKVFEERETVFRQETVSGGETILTAMGSIGGETAAEFGRRLDSLAAGRATTVTLDLSQATGMTSAAIGMILALRKKLVDQKKILRIQGCSDQLLSVFKMIKLDSIISIQR